MFWLMHISIFTLIWLSQSKSFWKDFLGCVMYVPALMLYCYPLMYWVLPKYLLKGKYVSLTIIMLTWVVIVCFLNFYFRAYIFIPIEKSLYFEPVPLGIYKNPYHEGTLMEISLTAGATCMITLFKVLVIKKQEWMQAQQAKITAELQLLKAQVHPHFLFNTLNNIYAFSLENSPKTPGLILKLASLLTYMLNDCKADEVLLEKEIEVMKNYIGLEKERYGNKIELSLNIQGDIKGQYIAPLLMLPFLENAFKHGTSELLEKPWLNMDISVKKQTLRYRLVNSKIDIILTRNNGIGIENVKRRLALLYPGKHELTMNMQKQSFEVSLLIELIKDKMPAPFASSATMQQT